MLKEYKNQGYYLVNNLFPQVTIEHLKWKFTNIFQLYTKSTKDLDQMAMELFTTDFEAYVGCCNVCQNLVELNELTSHPDLIDTLKGLGLRQCSINTRPLVSFSSPFTAKAENYWKVPAHQDWPSTQGSLNGITCWTPLIDIPAELGPLEVVPGSHRLGFLPCDETTGVPILKDNTEYDFMPIPMKVGDILFFSNFLIHRSGINTSSNKIRISMHFRYDDYTEPSFINRKYPRHRIDKRKEGILFPGFPTREEINTFFDDHQ